MNGVKKCERMLAFLSLCILLGLVYKLRITMHWSGRDIYCMPVFDQLMPRDPFLLQLWFLHWNDNDSTHVNSPDRDRLHKIRPIISKLRNNCAYICKQPGRDICVDESVVLYKVRLEFKQFMHTKQARFGLKLFELCTSSDILLDFMVFHGKMWGELVNIPGHNFLFSEQIPLTLMGQYLYKWHRLSQSSQNSSNHLNVAK